MLRFIDNLCGRNLNVQLGTSEVPFRSAYHISLNEFCFAFEDSKLVLFVYFVLHFIYFYLGLFCC